MLAFIIVAPTKPQDISTPTSQSPWQLSTKICLSHCITMSLLGDYHHTRAASLINQERSPPKLTIPMQTRGIEVTSSTMEQPATLGTCRWKTRESCSSSSQHPSICIPTGGFTKALLRLQASAHAPWKAKAKIWRRSGLMARWPTRWRAFLAAGPCAHPQQLGDSCNIKHDSHDVHCSASDVPGFP